MSESLKLVHQLFEDQVRRAPGAVAVQCLDANLEEAESLTYSELNARANQLARYLRERQIGPDQLVGLCVERGLEMVVGVLGTLKAGGAYVPLDPGYPAERLQYMLGDSASQVLLTQARLKGRLPQTTAEVIALDEQWDEIARESSDNLDIRGLGLGSRHLVYLIYTSGSTGQPKGVMVEHAGLSNYLQWALHAYVPESGDGAPVSSPLSFDATVTSLYTPLLAGRTVVMIPSGQELAGLEHLLLQPRKWSLVKISPAHLQVLGQRLKALQPPCTVGAFVIGGEALLPATVQLWRSIWPATRLINEYGPTETVVGCCVYDVPQDWIPGGSVPIGRPITNTQMHILNAERQPVPIGEIGEIYIGGAGVARGYLNRPELTAERFVQDPFSSDSGARIYKTGDLARRREDGDIEYLGRNDSQVKIRGFRIELGEIETHLLEYPQVKEAVVVARDTEPSDRRLIAYVVFQTASAVADAAHSSPLREHLKRVLPEYMVPSAFVELESLPLTANGKVDRSALPDPTERPKGIGAYVAPRTDIERKLAEIWSQVLQVDQVGVHDGFLELGGQSLQAMKLVAQIAEKLGTELSIVEVLQSPTVERLAKLIDSGPSLAANTAGIDELEYEEGVI